MPASPLAPVKPKVATRKRAAAKRSQKAAPSTLPADFSAKHVAAAMSPAHPDHHAGLEALRRATPEQREAVCPAGLMGKQRTRFINDAVTTRIDIEIARQHRQIQEALEATKKENTMPAKTSNAGPADLAAMINGTTKRSRKQSEQPTSSRTAKRAAQPQDTVITASSIAKDNDLNPVAFRKWLRAENLRDAERTAVFADKRKRTAIIKRFVKAQEAVAA